MRSEQIINDFEKSIRQMLAEIGKVSEKYLNSFEIDGEKRLLFSPENMQISNELQREVETVTQKYGKVFERYARQLIQMNISVKGEFDGLGTQQQLDRAMQRINDTLLSFGIQPNGKILPNSFLATFISAEPLRLEITKYLQESVATGKSFTETLTQFNKQFLGHGELTGKVANYFRTAIHDLTWQMERNSSYTFATTLNLQYFIHDGTLMETSREFCMERAGKVHHIQDVEKWEKNLPYFPENYDYFKHSGGYNCNHRTRWLSNEVGRAMYLKQNQNA